jgi:GMP synthase (glutamine-hydrolysing)
MSKYRRALVLQHLDREGPGLIADMCGSRGLGIDTLRLDLGFPVPATLAPDALLVVMGGSMGVGDIGDPRYPQLADEVALLRNVLAAEQPVLGVCLGAQLLAYAAGARVYPNRQPGPDGVLRTVREVGFGSIRLLGGEREPALRDLPTELPVLHWHGDTFDLPAGAAHLAESDDCRHQAFRIGRRAFGLQFHIETDAALVRDWATADAAFVEAAVGPDGPSRIIAASDAGAAAMRGPGERLIGNLLDLMLT